MSSQTGSLTPSIAFPTSSERLLKSREVAEWLGVSVDWVQAHATRRNPRIRAVLLGSGPTGRQMFRFRRADVERFIADHLEGGGSLRRGA
jgi:predicted DNA-binding transcriptional regulator AlpA